MSRFKLFTFTQRISSSKCPACNHFTNKCFKDALGSGEDCETGGLCLFWPRHFKQNHFLDLRHTSADRFIVFFLMMEHCFKLIIELYKYSASHNTEMIDRINNWDRVFTYQEYFSSTLVYLLQWGLIWIYIRVCVCIYIYKFCVMLELFVNSQRSGS